VLRGVFSTPQGGCCGSLTNILFPPGPRHRPIGAIVIERGPEQAVAERRFAELQEKSPPDRSLLPLGMTGHRSRFQRLRGMNYRRQFPMVRVLRCFVGALLCLAPTTGWAQVASVSADTMISQANPTLNFGNLGTLSVNAQSAALVQFDLSTLPSGLTAANIQKATMTVFVNKVLIAGSLDFSSTNQPWTEMGVTYNSFNLSLEGAPFEANVPTSSAGFVTIDVTNQVMNWLTNPAMNWGVLIRPSLAQPSTSLVLDSKESTTTSHAAFLNIFLASGGPAGPTGATGVAGPAGTTGPSGPAGIAGPTGATGVAGPAGTTGPSGPAGIAGPTGATGVAGPAGPSGPLGPQGVAGPSGPLGPQGAAGPSGPLGAQGVAGPSGPLGPQGVAGPAGPSGPLGPAGASGPSGPQGTAGAAGPSGPLGPAGASGPSGPQGTAGPAGPSGPLGPAGASGPSGPQGTAGAAGPTGPLGPAGASGPSGPAGTNGAGVFGASQINPNNLTPFYLSLNGDSLQNSNSAQFTGMSMPVACTFDRLSVTLAAVSGGATDTVTVALVKNGTDTSMTCTVTSSSSINGLTACSSATPISTALGDIVGLHVTQTNSTPIVRIAIGTRCQ
jgi:hypothetical protein